MIRTSGAPDDGPPAKIQKALLRRDGVTADTWDREAAGLGLRAERLGSGARD